MRNQSQVRNYIRTILYDNRLKRYTEGLHSLFVGENNAMNAFRRGDILQVKKHIDFGKEFSNIKNLRAYYERNLQVILRDGPANRSLTEEDFQDILNDLQEQRLNGILACLAKANVDYLETPFGKDCLSILDTVSGEEENLTDEQICCGFYMLAQFICGLLPITKCYIDLQRRILQSLQQKLLEAGCDCRISGPVGSPACNGYCSALRILRKQLKELEDDYEEGQKNCKKMLSEFEEGGQYANCLEFMNRNRSSNLRNRIMSLNPTNNTTRNSPSSSPLSSPSSPSSPSTPPPSSPPSDGGGGGYGY